MDVSIYSLSIIAGFVIARLGVECTNIRLRIGPVRIHHWMWATAIMLAVALSIELPDAGWGLLVGIALEGLRRKDWGWRVK